MSYPTLNTATDPKIREILEDKRQRVLRDMNLLGRFMVKTRAVRMWRVGGGTSMLVNWWNPIAWLWIVLAVIAVFITSGVEGVRRDADGLGLWMSSYWKENRDAREWITAKDLKESKRNE